LKKIGDGFGITEAAETGANRHCLLDSIDTDDHIEKWITRIRATPDFLIDDICAGIVEAGVINFADVEEVKKFLKRRRDNIDDIIRSAQKEFSGIKALNLWWKKKKGA
jgi:hypothetical protein